MVKISGHMVAVVVVDHNQGLMTKTKNGIFGYQESEGKLHKNFVYFYVKFSMHIIMMIYKVQCSKIKIIKWKAKKLAKPIFLLKPRLCVSDPSLFILTPYKLLPHILTTSVSQLYDN